MGRTAEEVRGFLHEGESVREAFDVGPARVVMTSHRVFVHDPDEGLRQTALSDVTAVERRTRGSSSTRNWALSLAVVGLAFLLAGFAVARSDVFSPDFQNGGTSKLEGGLATLVDWTLWTFENLDVLLAGTGLFVLLLALALAAYYWVYARERSLTIATAGDKPNIYLPLGSVAVEDEFRLEKKLVGQVSDDLDIDEGGTVDFTGDDGAGVDFTEADQEGVDLAEEDQEGVDFTEESAGGAGHGDDTGDPFGWDDLDEGDRGS